MNDLEICKRIAEIEGIPHKIDVDYLKNKRILLPNKYCEENKCSFVYDPLTDDALWLQLAFKFEISISFVFCKALMVKDGVFERNFTDALSLKRNALLLIIEAHKDSQ